MVGATVFPFRGDEMLSNHNPVVAKDTAPSLAAPTLTRGRTTARSVGSVPMPVAKREKQIIALLRVTDGPLHAEDIGAAIGLAGTRVRAICDNLREAGVLERHDVRAPKPNGGRPLHLFTLTPEYAHPVRATGR